MTECFVRALSLFFSFCCFICVYAFFTFSPQMAVRAYTAFIWFLQSFVVTPSEIFWLQYTIPTVKFFIVKDFMWMALVQVFQLMTFVVGVSTKVRKTTGILLLATCFNLFCWNWVIFVQKYRNGYVETKLILLKISWICFMILKTNTKCVEIWLFDNNMNVLWQNFASKLDAPFDSFSFYFSNF